MTLTRNIYNNKSWYLVNKPIAFDFSNSLSRKVINQCAQFAYEMSFGAKGQHRANRTGGRNKRRNGEIFCDAFNGKLGEFAIHQHFNKNNIQLPLPDLTVYNLGKWDDSDFFYNGRNIAVKTTKHIGNLLLLEKNDWDQNGCYIPNSKSSSGGKYDAIILVRTNSNMVERFRSIKKYYSDEITRDELNGMFKDFSCSFDIPGYVSNPTLKQVIARNQIIHQGNLFGYKKIEMDATNYYIQSGNLSPINNLINQLVNNNVIQPIN